MNFQFSGLVSQIIKGLESYFEKNQIEVNEYFFDEPIAQIDVDPNYLAN